MIVLIGAVQGVYRGGEPQNTVAAKWVGAFWIW